MTRLAGKTAIVVGGGQTPGATIGNGRATVLRFAQEGARIAVLDKNLASARETVDMIADLDLDPSPAHENFALQMDVTDESSVDEALAQAIERLGGWTSCTTTSVSAAAMGRRCISVPNPGIEYSKPIRARSCSPAGPYCPTCANVATV